MNNQKVKSKQKEKQAKKFKILILLTIVIISGVLLTTPFIVSAIMDTFPAPIGIYILGSINSLIVFVLAVLLVIYGKKILNITSKEGSDKIFKAISIIISILLICLALLFLFFILIFGYLNLMNYA